MIATTAMKLCSSSKPSWSVPRTKLPCPSAVPSTAPNDAMKVATAAPRGPNRTAAHASNGMSRCGARKAALTPWAGPKTSTSTSVISSASSSISFMLPVGRVTSRALKVSASGATTRLPIMSPTHQTSKVVRARL